MELGPLAQRSLKSPCTFYLPILFPSSLKGHLKESEPGILRAAVARIRKHCPQRVEKSKKGKKGESRLARSPVPPGVDGYPIKGAGAKRRYIILLGGLAKRECQSQSCHMWGDGDEAQPLCRVLGALIMFTMHRSSSLLSFHPFYWLSSCASVSGWLKMTMGITLGQEWN